MGRIKTTLIKRFTLKLFREYKPKFKGSFSENKKVVDELAEIPSKKMRNIVAGYATRLVKKQLD